MSAKIIIERRIKQDCLGSILELSVQLRALAVQQPGYISGETLVSAEHDDTHLVISTWRNLSDWRAWEENPERIKIAQEIEKLLVDPPSVKAFIDLYGSGAG